MYGDISKKDNDENVRLFSNINVSQPFSNYSLKLNRLFDSRTFERFYDDLKKFKRCKGDFFTEMLNENKGNYYRDRYEKEIKKFDITEYRRRLKELNRKEREKQKEKENKRYILKEEHKYSKEISLKTEGPDIGQYSPNYNAIYKKVPNIYISRYKYQTPSPERVDKPEKTKKLFISTEPNSYRKNANLTQSMQETSTSQRAAEQTITSLKHSVISGSPKKSPKKTLTTLHKKSRNQSLEKLDKSKEVTKQSSPERTKSIFKSTSPSIQKKNKSFSPNQKALRGVVDFNKMSSNHMTNGFPFINMKNDFPTIGTYKPRYNYVYNRVQNIYIDKRGVKVDMKRLNMHKVLCSYRVPPDYLTVKGLN